MKILIDMNLSPLWVDCLAEADIEAMHWSKIGPATAPDPEIMAYAKAHDFIVLTHDLDFSEILAATQRKKPSVIQIRGQQVHPKVIGQKVVDAIKQSKNDLEAGALLGIDPKRVRIRILPLSTET